jgi:hypothetical protein
MIIMYPSHNLAWSRKASERRGDAFEVVSRSFSALGPLTRLSVAYARPLAPLYHLISIYNKNTIFLPL